MKKKILVTGSSGLIGTRLCQVLEEEGSYEAVPFDVRNNPLDNILIFDRLHKAMVNCDGVVHLAAVSRVIDGEKNYELTDWTNVRGTENVIVSASRTDSWMIYASSREVYGNCGILPVTEEKPLAPMNAYGLSKSQAEFRVRNGPEGRRSILRFSNVYGTFKDHADRVVPAFMAAARDGRALHVEGTDVVLDFVHVDDAVDGIMRSIEMHCAGRQPPPMHLTTGVGTSLLTLARLCRDLYDSKSVLMYESPRDFDVPKFYGSFELAQELLGWFPKVSLEEGLQRMKET